MVGKPEIAVRTARNPVHAAAGGNAVRVFRDHSAGRDTPHCRAAFDEPEIAVGAEHEALRTVRDVILGNRAGRCDPSDFIRIRFGEPQIAVRSGDNAAGARSGT